jgi:hypothetical protein
LAQALLYRQGMSVTSDNALDPDPAFRASMSRVTLDSCRCGDVGYRITGNGLRVVGCQLLFVPARQFQWTRGEGQVVSYRLPGPRPYSTAYCRRCGADVPRVSPGMVVVSPAPYVDSQAPLRGDVAGPRIPSPGTG